MQSSDGTWYLRQFGDMLLWTPRLITQRRVTCKTSPLERGIRIMCPVSYPTPGTCNVTYFPSGPRSKP